MSKTTADLLRQIAAANRKTAKWITKRDRLIVEAHLSGASLRAIASACELSHMSIKRIINKENPK